MFGNFFIAGKHCPLKDVMYTRVTQGEVFADSAQLGHDEACHELQNIPLHFGGEFLFPQPLLSQADFLRQRLTLSDGIGELSTCGPQSTPSWYPKVFSLRKT